MTKKYNIGIKQPLINWEEFDKNIETGEYGIIKYQRFCELEHKRIGNHTKVVRNGILVCLQD